MMKSSAEDASVDFLSEVSGNPTHATNLRTYEFTQRNEHDEATSLLDRPITAASDDGVCRRHACQVVADTREITEIKFDLHHKLNNK